MSRLYPLIPIIGIGLISGLFTWIEGIGKEPWQHRYQDALNDGRLDPSMKECEYEELEWKYGSYIDYKNESKVDKVY